ncbi:MAG: spondin domain-containing protein [Pseudomonadota bacterium]
MKLFQFQVRRWANVMAVIAVAIITLPTAAADDDNWRGATYRVTITNLTTGQPFTPPVLAVHNRRANVFALGTPASEGVRQIAENGNNAPLVEALRADYNVREVLEGTAPVVPAANPGGTPFDSQASFTFRTRGNARYVSFVSMLICTNDGFTGINTIRLPRTSTTILARGYETRTEQNTEDFADIVPPCQGLIGVSSDDAGTGESNPALGENGIVIPHQGVVGDNDLVSRVHNWADPVAKIVIERVRPNRRY